MRLVQAVVGVALVATLGGCFLLPVADEAGEKPETVATQSVERAPEVGDCWTASDYDWALWDSWRGDPPVDCQEDHESYTYAVLDLLEGFDEIYLANGFVMAEPSQLAFDSCSEALGEFMGAPVGELARMVAQYYLPSKSEWKDGARWVRCDALVYELGSSVYEQVFAELPDDESSLIDAIEENADYFDLCLDTDEGFTGYGPYFSDTAVYSDCSVDPMWRLDGFDTIPGEYNTDYPGDDAIAQFATDGCLADVEPTQWSYAHFPDSDSWFTGDRMITCWTYEWDVPADAVPPV